MRKILFRGKRCDNGEWAEGYFVYCKSDFDEESERTAEIISHDADRIYDGEYCSLGAHKVILETVGQFTGMTDKNGKRVFEGDVLKIAKVSDGTGHYYVPPLDYPVNVVVEWDMCAWMWETLCEDKRYIGFPEAWCHYECEVIGNAHDNPELLEGR